MFKSKSKIRIQTPILNSNLVIKFMIQILKFGFFFHKTAFPFLFLFITFLSLYFPSFLSFHSFPSFFLALCLCSSFIAAPLRQPFSSAALELLSPMPPRCHTCASPFPSAPVPAPPPARLARTPGRRRSSPLSHRYVTHEAPTFARGTTFSQSSLNLCCNQLHTIIALCTQFFRFPIVFQRQPKLSPFSRGRSSTIRASSSYYKRSTACPSLPSSIQPSPDVQQASVWPEHAMPTIFFLKFDDDAIKLIYFSGGFLAKLTA